MPPSLGRLLVMLILARGPVSAAAQEEPGSVRPFVEADIAVSTLHQDAVILGSLGAGLRVTPWLEVSGGGSLLLAPVDLGDVGLQTLQMKVGWGGVSVTAGPRPPAAGATWFLRSSVAVGNVDLQDRETGLQTDSDNVVLLEPGAGVRTSLPAGMEGRVMLSYRWVYGVDGLPVVSASDLRSFSVRIGLLLGPF